MSHQSVVRKQPWTEPRDRFVEFAVKPYAVWLDTVTGATGYSILAAGPSKIVRSKGSHTDIVTPAGTTVVEGNPFDILDEQLALHHLNASTDFPLGAAIGYFGYDLKNFIEKLPAKAADDIGLPDCWFGIYDSLLVLDHSKKKEW